MLTYERALLGFIEDDPEDDVRFHDLLGAPREKAEPGVDDEIGVGAVAAKWRSHAKALATRTYKRCQSRRPPPMKDWA